MLNNNLNNNVKSTNKSTNVKYVTSKHPFHMVKPSKWPFQVSLHAFIFALSLVACFNDIKCPIPFFKNFGSSGIIFFLVAVSLYSILRLYGSTFRNWVVYLHLGVMTISGLAAAFGVNCPIPLFQDINSSFLVLLATFISLVYTIKGWWLSIIEETVVEGNHTSYVQNGLRFGMILFIISEVMLFFAFFWAYFHASVSPDIAVGGIWPPAGIEVFNPWGVPLLNTLILLTSGATLTWSHHALTGKMAIKESKLGLLFTILLGVIFTGFQIYEYAHASFTIADGVYGSTFYLATGLHGFHVLIGTIFLIVCYYRLSRLQFHSEHHVGYEAAIWYWHFVDVVWLFLFVSIYWWGS